MLLHGIEKSRCLGRMPFLKISLAQIPQNLTQNVSFGTSTSLFQHFNRLLAAIHTE